MDGERKSKKLGELYLVHNELYNLIREVSVAIEPQFDTWQANDQVFEQ